MFRAKKNRFKKTGLTCRKSRPKASNLPTNKVCVSPRTEEALAAPSNKTETDQCITTHSPWKVTPRKSEAAQVLASLAFTLPPAKRGLFTEENASNSEEKVCSPSKKILLTPTNSGVPGSPRLIRTPSKSPGTKTFPRLIRTPSSSPKEKERYLDGVEPLSEENVSTEVSQHFSTDCSRKNGVTPRQSEAAQVLASLAFTLPPAKRGLFNEEKATNSEENVCSPPKRIFLSPMKTGMPGSPRLIRTPSVLKMSPARSQHSNESDLDGVAPLPEENFSTAVIEELFGEERAVKHTDEPTGQEKPTTDQLEVAEHAGEEIRTDSFGRQVFMKRVVLTYEYLLTKSPKEFRRLTGLYQEHFSVLLAFLDEKNAEFDEPILMPLDTARERLSEGLVYRCDRPAPKKFKPSFLPPETRLLITLLRLRRGWDVLDLALFFGVSDYVISRTVYTWVQFMYHQFKRIQREMFVSRHHQPKKERPAVFKPFDNFRVCLDTTEVRIQTPHDLDQQGNTFSDYKAGNVWLYLIGISCWGGISFISPGFEGSMSDEEIYRQSGIRDFLEPSDVILPDRGFRIEEECDEDQVVVLHPPFLKGRTHFTPEEEMITREVFRILKKITNTMLHYLDQLVYVVACLVNFLPCVVKDKIVQKLD